MTEPGLTIQQYAPGSLAGGSYHQVTITFNNATSSPASFRFAYSRANGDIADAAAAAKGKALAIVFLNDQGASTSIPNPYGLSPTMISAPEQLSPQSTQLVDAVAAANPNTVVVLNTANPILMPWLPQREVGARDVVLKPGGRNLDRTAAARACQPERAHRHHLARERDRHAGAYDETKPLYPGDTPGPHLERLNGGANGTTNETEGIYNGYRFFDKEGITPLYPFGFGLSYTTFGYSNLQVTRDGQAGLNVSVTGLRTPVASPVMPSRRSISGRRRSLPRASSSPCVSSSSYSRVSLAPGASQTVTMTVAPRALEYWNTSDQRWTTAAGRRTVYVGSADALADLPVQATVSIPASSSITCDDQQLSATTVQGNVIVPGGDWCDLVSDTISGSVRASGDGLRVVGTTIGGNLRATGVSGAGDQLSAGTNVVCNSTIHGSLIVSGSNPNAPWNLGQCGPNTLGGSLTFTGNRAAGNVISGNRVHGNLVCSPGERLRGAGNAISGRRVGSCGV